MCMRKVVTEQKVQYTWYYSMSSYFRSVPWSQQSLSKWNIPKKTRIIPDLGFRDWLSSVTSKGRKGSSKTWGRKNKPINPQLHQAALPHLPFHPPKNPHQKHYAWGQSSMNQVKNYRKVLLYHYFGECSMPYSITDGKSQLRLSWYSVLGLAGSTARGLWSVRTFIGDGFGEALFKVTCLGTEGQQAQAPFPHTSLQDHMLCNQFPSLFAHLPISRKSLLLLSLR